MFERVHGVFGCRTRSMFDNQIPRSHVRTSLQTLVCRTAFDEPFDRKNTSDAIIVYLRGAINSTEVSKSLAPRDARQPWIMLTFEAPPLANSIHHTKYKNLNGLFNRTMMYRRDADIRVPHGFVVSHADAKYLPDAWVMPPVKEEIINTSRKLAVAFISNCGAKSNRLSYVRNFQEHAPVDIYGKCGTHKCGHSMYVDHNYNATNNPCLKMAAERYLFYFAFENAFCEEYLTEKVYNLLFYPIVPVVRGSADYKTLLPPNSYIDGNNYTPKELAEKLLFLQNHPEVCFRMFLFIYLCVL
ncbi:hypothetical protein SK128_018735 [Halocaridina rubra]|uniref:Fucosyltransferase n=1 Tax=Halocaridina rubra TaxID=373956 RepID=A0AAN8ZYK0_HALRR